MRLHLHLHLLLTCRGQGLPSQTASQRVSPMHKQDYRRAHIRNKGTILGHPAQKIKKTTPLGPTKYLLYKATQQRLGFVTDLLNT